MSLTLAVLNTVRKSHIFDIPVEYNGFRNIESIGLELEGGYCNKCVNSIFHKYGESLHLETGGDCTVSVRFFCTKHEDWDVHSGAELKVWASIENLSLLFDFVKELFESRGFKQNNSCGNHVHFMFQTADQYAFIWNNFGNINAWDLFDKQYTEYFHDNQKYIDRLYSDWASHVWAGQLSLNSKSKMYTFNRRNGTFEVRVLPYFNNAEEAQKSYLWLFRLIDKMVNV